MRVRRIRRHEDRRPQEPDTSEQRLIRIERSMVRLERKQCSACCRLLQQLVDAVRVKQ
jgi:hypothetical protein